MESTCFAKNSLSRNILVFQGYSGSLPGPRPNRWIAVAALWVEFVQMLLIISKKVVNLAKPDLSLLSPGGERWRGKVMRLGPGVNTIYQVGHPYWHFVAGEGLTEKWRIDIDASFCLRFGD